MTRTRDELIDATLYRLMGGEGQQFSADQRQKVEERIAPLLASMAVRNIIAIPYSNEFPLYCFSELVEVLVANCAEDMGFPPRDQDAAEQKLHLIARVGSGVFRPLRVDSALTSMGRRN